MSETTLTSPSTITPLQSMLHEFYSLLEQWKFPDPDGAGSYAGYTGGFYKFAIGSNRTTFGFNVDPSAWSSGVTAFDFGPLGGLRSDGSVVELAANSYFDGTNQKAKATGRAGRMYFNSGLLQYDYAASFSAGATQTFSIGYIVDTSGNFMIGNNTATITPTNGVSITSTGGGTQVAIGHLVGTVNGTTYLAFAYNGGTIGYVGQNGTTGVTYSTTSDIRLKENVVDAPDAGAIVDAIKVRSFRWKSAPDEAVDFGFIAQELVNVAPQAVRVGDGGAEVEEAWGVDASRLVPILLREVQSLRARVAALETP